MPWTAPTLDPMKAVARSLESGRFAGSVALRAWKRRAVAAVYSAQARTARGHLLRHLPTSARHRVAPYIKVHGPLRSGTNYVATLLERSYRVRALSADHGGWKHGPIDHDDMTSFVVVLRHPLAWLRSFFEWERIHGRTTHDDLSEFASAAVTHPAWKAAWAADGAGPVEAWNRAVRSWVAQSDARDNVMVVRYEDVLTNPSTALAPIERGQRWERRASGLVDVTERADSWTTPRPRRPLKRSDSRLDAWHELAPGSLTDIASLLDDGLLVRLDYRIESDKRTDRF